MPRHRASLKAVLDEAAGSGITPRFTMNGRQNVWKVVGVPSGAQYDERVAKLLGGDFGSG
jgi:hypothetical protein